VALGHSCLVFIAFSFGFFSLEPPTLRCSTYPLLGLFCAFPPFPGAQLLLCTVSPLALNIVAHRPLLTPGLTVIPASFLRPPFGDTPPSLRKYFAFFVRDCFLSLLDLGLSLAAVSFVHHPTCLYSIAPADAVSCRRLSTRLLPPYCSHSRTCRLVDPPFPTGAGGTCVPSPCGHLSLVFSDRRSTPHAMALRCSAGIGVSAAASSTLLSGPMLSAFPSALDTLIGFSGPS